jgi:hypothetical protein
MPEPLVYDITTHSSTSNTGTTTKWAKIKGSNYDEYLDGDRTIPSTIDEYSVTHIINNNGDGAFKNTALNSITIPSSVTNIEKSSFAGADLTHISIYNTTVIEGGTDEDKAFLSIGTTTGKVFVKVNGITTASVLNAWKFNNKDKFSFNPSVSGGTIAFVTGNSIATEVSTITDNNQYVFNIINPISVPKEVQLGSGTTIGGNGVISTSDQDYVPPETFSGGMFKVTQIGTDAFRGQSDMTSFIIPQTVTKIMNNAFQNCSSLATVTFAGASTCTSIGDNAFENIVASSVTIPNSVTEIGNEAFKGSSLTSISVKSTTSIGTDAFSDMEVTGHVTVTVRGITSASELNTWKDSNAPNDNASKFSLTSNNYSITFVFDSGTTPIMTATVAGINYVFTPIPVGYLNVQIGDGSSTAGNGTTTSGITTLVIPGTFPGGFTVTKVGANAFADISGITEVTIPTSVTTIGDNAFKGTGITTFNLQNVTTIGANAFDGTDLTTITVPDTVTSIGASAFANTTALHTISVRQNNVTYGTDAFATISPTMISVTVRGISVASDLASWKTANSSHFTTESIGNAPVAFLAGDGGFMTETETVSNITYVFSFTSESTDDEFKVRIGDGTTTKNNGTTTPSYIPTIFTPPTSFTGGLFVVTEIGTNAFNGLRITDLTIPDTIVTIGDDAFTDIGLSILTDIGDTISTPSIPPKVTVPSTITTTADLVAYQFASSFSGANNMPVVFSTVYDSSQTISGIMIETGSDYVFTVIAPATDLQKVRIGTGGGSASAERNGMRNTPSSTETIEPPNTFRGGFYSVTVIGQKAFQGITIQGLIIHPAVTDILAHAFKNVVGIATISISQNTAIANSAFSLMNIGNTTLTVTVEDLTSAQEFTEWKNTNALSNSGKFSKTTTTSSGGTIVYTEGVVIQYDIINSSTITITGTNINSGLVGNRIIRDMIGGLPVTAIANDAFIGSQLVSISFPSTLLTIGARAFQNVDTLTTVTYYNSATSSATSSVTSIGANAFENTSITKFVVPITMTSIGAGAFYNIGTLTLLSFTTGRNVNMTIGDTAFKSTAITSVSFPETVTSIGSEAFADISNLRMIGVYKDTSLSKDSNLNTNTYMNTSTFTRLSNHTTVIVYGLSSSSVVDSRYDLSAWKTEYETAFNLSFTAPDDAYIKFVTNSGHIILQSFEGVFYIINVIGTGSDQKARIGNNTTIPGNGLAFPHLQYNDSLSLPATCSTINIGGTTETYSITKIGTHAFSYVNMSGVVIPSRITHIGSSAFYDTSLTSMTFNEVMETQWDSNSELVEIGSKAFMNAFNGTSHVTISIPRNVETIKTNAFRNNNALSQVSLNRLTIIDTNAFRNMASNSRVLVINSPELEMLHSWRITNKMKFSTVDGSEMRFIPYYGGVTSSVCFPAGTPVDTDQGLMDIDKICVENHTIGGSRIVAVTRTVSEDECLVRFESGSLAVGIPSAPTEMSCMHSVLYKGDMTPSFILANMNKATKVPYTRGTFLFNVLLDTHSKMMINNMTAETLHPDNGVAKFTRALLAVSDEGDRAEMMYNYNRRAAELGVFTSIKHRL